MKWHAEDIYNQNNYFENSDGAVQFRQGMLKYGDAVCAIGYSLGIDSFEEIKKIYNFLDIGQHAEELNAKEQMNLIKEKKSREPKHILEIGAGRGEVSIALSHLLNIKTTSVEPNKNFLYFLNKTVKYFNINNKIKNIENDNLRLTPYRKSKLLQSELSFPQKINNKNLNVINKDVVNAIIDIDWKSVDTVIMVESLEHILKKDFDKIYSKILHSLKKNKGRFIITNWLTHHPLELGAFGVSKREHCRVVNDELYDAFVFESNKVIYRNNSHIVLEY